MDQETRRILGCHIVGSEAADLVQQVVFLMNAGNHDYMPLVKAQIIHPALSEVVINAFANMTPSGHVHKHAHGDGDGHNHAHGDGEGHKHAHGNGHGHGHEH